MMGFPPDYFVGKRVTVMGLGHLGGQIAAIRFLAGQGAELTVTDITAAEKLTGSLKQIEDLPVRLHLGGHVETDFTDTDLVVVSPAVPKSSRYLKLADRAGVALTCEMNLFLDRCRANVIGVTGTVGKSTTVAMLEAIFHGCENGDPAACPFRKVWVGGNIGKSLLEHLGQIETRDLVVLELSSFQLEDMADIEYSPHIAVVTNLFPNHLDRHANLQAYIDAKANITRYQLAGDVLITNANNIDCTFIEQIAPGDVTIWRFGAQEGQSPAGARQVVLSGSAGRWRVRSAVGDLGGEIISSDHLPVVGRHNMENAAAAASAALAIGIPPDVIGSELRRFKGLADRLERVAEIDNVRWYNDSKSTTPQSGIVALQAFEPNTAVVIAGGYDKELDLEPFAKELAGRAKLTICLGQTGPEISRMVALHGGSAIEVPTLDEAVRQADRQAQGGEVVLLSPGCASWDMFENYQARGRRFRELVEELTNPVAAG